MKNREKKLLTTRGFEKLQGHHFNEEMAKVFEKSGNKIMKAQWDKKVEKILSEASGKESPKQLREKVIQDLFDDALLKKIKTVAPKAGKR